MEGENESNNDKDKSVKELQSSLFPIPEVKMENYFANFFFKNYPLGDVQEMNDVNLKNDLIRNPLCMETNFKRELPRWPIECQVAEPRIKHISYIPNQPEPYYKQTGNEPTPKPVGEDSGLIVYQYTPISVCNYFTRSSVMGSKYLLSPTIYEDFDTLQFESRFECGNLERAYKITSSYYELQLRTDLYTDHHVQWFYFRISNMRKNFLYRFSIVNFSKDSSLFNDGMRPVMYSVKDAQINNIGWRRFGDNIVYYNNDRNPYEREGPVTYTLTFTTEFPHDNDQVYFAHCYPYSYSDLEDHLSEITNHPIKSQFTTVRLLCKSLAGNNIHQVTITSPELEGGDTMKKKQAIVITARVHPGETPASWMMKGFLDFLTSDNSVAKELRDKFIFKLVPMLNPDGVIVGNNRCALSTKDLNRQYRSVMKEAYPSIWYTKLMIRRLMEECGVVMYCDLHAHSRKHNIFIYGCENKKSAENKLQEQVFPLLLHKNSADKFCFRSCKFQVQKAKEGTGRIVMWMMGIINSYTLEASFAGSTLSNRNKKHFSPVDFEQMAKSFCQTLYDYYDVSPRKEKFRNKIIAKLLQEGSNANDPTNVNITDYSSDDGDTSSATSDGGEMEDILRILAPPPSPEFGKKKIKKKFRKKKINNNNKATTKNIERKPLPMCNATLGIDESYNNHTDSEIDYNAFEAKTENDPKESNMFTPEQVKLMINPKTEDAARTNKKKKVICTSYEIVYNENNQLARSLSQITFTKKKADVLIQPKKTIRKNTITQQLSQVQAKLYSMRNRLWLGAGDEDIYVPLCWNTNDYNMAEPFSTKNQEKTQKSLDSQPKSAPTKNDKKPSNKIPKAEVELKKKAQPGLQRQHAVDLGKQNNKRQVNLQKAKSCPADKQKQLIRRNNGEITSAPKKEKTQFKTITKEKLPKKILKGGAQILKVQK